MSSGKELAFNGMQITILIILVSSSPAFSSPQYTGQTVDLSEQQQYTVDEIFGGMGSDEGYTGSEVLNEDGYVAPDDYHQSELNDQATAVVDNIFENCADYTASQGYECVPYYQCHNGTIITDGGGLIDIRNGFGILSPEDSKCPGKQFQVFFNVSNPFFPQAIWMCAARTQTLFPLPRPQCKPMFPSVARGTRTVLERGSRVSPSTSPSLGNGLTCALFLRRRWSAKAMGSQRPSICKFNTHSSVQGDQGL